MTSRRAQAVHFVIIVMLIAALALLVMFGGATVIEWGK